MRSLKDSKYDNRSTSGSDYFNQRFTKSNTSNINSNGYSKKLNEKPSQIYLKSQYEICQPSQSQMSSFQSIYNSSLIEYQNFKPSSSKGEFQNFDKQNYGYSNIKDLNKPDSQIYASNIDINIIDPSTPKKQYFQSSLKKKNPFTHFSTELQYKPFTNISNLKTNSKEYKTLQYKDTQIYNNINFDNGTRENYIPETNKLINSDKQVQRYKSLSKVSDLARQKIYSQKQKAFGIKNREHNNFNSGPSIQPHLILQHIHFTLANSSFLSKQYKNFLQSKKHSLKKRFDFMIQQLTNCLNDIRVKMEKLVDQKYQVMLYELGQIKNQAQLMWKSKESNQNVPYLRECKKANFQGHFNPNRPTSRQNQLNLRKSTSSVALFSTKPSSPYYPILSSTMNKSPESNPTLLYQLQQEDQCLNQYKNLNQFYFQSKNDLGSQTDKLTKQFLLLEMFKNSKRVCKMMSECLNVSNIDQKRQWQTQIQNSNFELSNQQLQILKKNLKKWQRFVQNTAQTNKNQQGRHTNLLIQPYIQNKMNQIESHISQIRKSLKFESQITLKQS